MAEHLKSCINPIQRLRHKVYTFPKTVLGKEFCPLCGRMCNRPHTLGRHIAKRHADDTTELRAWGYDWDLMYAQYEMPKGYGYLLRA